MHLFSCFRTGFLFYNGILRNSIFSCYSVYTCAWVSVHWAICYLLLKDAVYFFIAYLHLLSNILVLCLLSVDQGLREEIAMVSVIGGGGEVPATAEARSQKVLHLPPRQGRTVQHL